MSGGPSCRLDHGQDVGQGGVELAGEVASRQGATGVDGDLAGDVERASLGGDDAVAEPDGGGEPLGGDDPVRGAHRPFQSGSRPSVKAAWNSAWSAVVISSAWVIASSSTAPARSRSSSRVSSVLVAR